MGGQEEEILWQNPNGNCKKKSSSDRRREEFSPLFRRPVDPRVPDCAQRA